MSDDNISKLNALLQEAELLKKVSPKFEELSFDIREIMQLSNNPAFIGALLFKLAEEREKSNQLMQKMLDKFDQIMLEMKTKNTSLTSQQNEVPSSKKIELLPEQDQLILQKAVEYGQVTAGDIKAALGYKGQNAASQRLNKLFKEGHLKKIQSGKKVYYLANI